MQFVFFLFVFSLVLLVVLVGLYVRSPVKRVLLLGLSGVTWLLFGWGPALVVTALLAVGLLAYGQVLSAGSLRRR